MVKAKTRGKPLRVLGGMLMMLGSVAVAFAILTQFAGHWGVPYFSFTTGRGSTCTNSWIGYTCDQLSVSDLNWWGDVSLPSETSVRSARYVSTHDYALNATVEVPKQQASSTLAALKESFGDCGDHPAPMSTQGLSDVCVMADNLADAGGNDPSKSSRTYTVGTAVRSNGVRLIVLDITSR